MNEADTCRKLVRPRLEAAGWDTLPHSYSDTVRTLCADQDDLRRSDFEQLSAVIELLEGRGIDLQKLLYAA